MRKPVSKGYSHQVLIVSDAWEPQVNGVVRTLSKVTQSLREQGHQVHIIEPAQFRTIACPTYPEIRLAVNAFAHVLPKLEWTQPTHIHIATEGPLGTAFRFYCNLLGLPYTTSFHTKFPEYVKDRFLVPLRFSYAWLRRFHNSAVRTMVSTNRMRTELSSRGFRELCIWSRGVDTELFRPEERCELGFKGPIHLYVGRVAIEKNLDAFLSLDLNGSKLVVGEGPQLEELRQRYPEVHFLGVRKGRELAQIYASADVFVFPSLTDTFGLVLLEALASGTPVAAFDVCGPKDVVNDKNVAVLGAELKESIQKARALSREDCRRYSKRFSWSASAQQFLSNLEPLPHTQPYGYCRLGEVEALP